MAGESAPLVKEVFADAPAAAATVAASEAVEAPFDGTVTAVTYTPTATITGVATNNRTIQVVNRGQSGAGSTVVATLTFGAGTNAAAFDETAVPLSGTPANLTVAAGDILEFRSSANGTGLADPGGRVAVTIARS